ncbi:MAG: radical SAM family heme chaperone HemW [Porphyromonadaceae bacterium]|nr:radical SAM family heme chaperone HemW [Porphyromonadaceae bacterium]
MAGLYVHIPFCRSRCIYCDFYSTTGEERLQGRYVEALLAEWRMRRSELQGAPIETLYMGGGTPSQLSPDLLRHFFAEMGGEIDFSRCREITVEVNPDDVTPRYASFLAALPVNRISMGVQSFSDTHLQFLHRRHTATEAIAAIGRLREAGFSNISIDLIYGLPGQTLADWESDLQQAIALDLPHISAYHLTYEAGTPIDRLRREGKVEECDEELSLRFFERLKGSLEAAGYEQYEISNFARPGCYARHNLSYWQDIPYLGLGAAAHSYDGAVRRCNPSSLTHYLECIEEGVSAYEAEKLTPDTRYNDRVVTALRTRWGLDLDRVAADFGEMRREYCLRMARPHIENGMLAYTDQRLTLTRRGVFISDGIISDLLYVD